MEIKLEKTAATQAKLQILVPGSTVNQRLDHYYTGLAKQAKIPGFRPGKAPKAVVKQHFGRDSLSDLTERMIAEFTLEAVKQHSLDLLYPPKLLATDLPQEDKDFKFEVELDLRPAVPDINWSGLEIEEVAEKSVSEKDIDDQIDVLLDTEATFVDLPAARPAQDGDHVTIGFLGTVDGVSAPELQSDNQSFVLGQKTFLPEFENAVRGLELNTKRKFDLKFPDDYHAENYRSKVATFEVELRQIKQKQRPSLSDEWVQGVFPELKTTGELREKISKELKEQRTRIALSAQRERVGDKLVELNPFDVNERQVSALAHQLAHDAHQMMHQMGVAHEETEEHMKALETSSMQKAKRDVQLSYLLQKIATTEKFEVVQADFEKRFEETAKKTGYSVSQVKSYYSGKDENSSISRMDRLRIDILDEKSLDYALSKATIKNKG